jgi:uncharacterized protein DUF664
VIAAVPSLDALSVVADDGGHFTLRWIIAHLLEETARHAGHADILRRADRRQHRTLAGIHEKSHASTTASVYPM